MNALTSISPVTVRTADLSDATARARIDTFVDRHAASTPFHRTAWSVAIEEGCRAKAHYLFAEQDGAVVAVLPLHEVRSPLFGNALVSAGFAVDGGLIGDCPQLIDEALKIAADRGCPTIELRGGTLPEEGWQIDEDTYLRFTQELKASDEEQLLAVTRRQRAEVRRSFTFDLSVEAGRSKELRDGHYRVYAESVRNLGTPVFPKKLFDAVLDAFGNDADILTVSKDGRTLSSVLSLYHKGVVMPFWGGGTFDARRWRANDLMYFELMNRARREKGCTSADFGRSKVGTGPAAFKKNWGFTPHELRYAKRALDGREIRDINPLSPKYRLQIALWQKLPLPVANVLGPWISRGLG